MKKVYIALWIILPLAFANTRALAQDPSRILRGAQGRFGRGQQQGQQQGDSLIHRTGLEDSITIRFRYLDSSAFHQFDSSVTDFTKHWPMPWDHVNLGNIGNASHSLIFSPILQSGWNPGFHAFDAYNLTLSSTRFYNTTRPYTELGYFLGSNAEQMVHLLHTQNIKPNWNASFQYRLINSPGTFQSQNTNLNHYRLASWYQGKSKRYQNFFVIIGNKMASAENGGMLDNGNYIDSIDFQDNRLGIPTHIGQGGSLSRNPFSTNIKSGSFYTNATFLMRQQYDVGQKDSVVINDTTVVPLFYPRLRFEHTISYRTYNYRFKDIDADTNYYRTYYDKAVLVPDSPRQVFRRDYWRNLENDFSIYTFPDAKNPQQFLKLGASFQILKADFDTGLVKTGYNNLFLHGEYRNKTRNQKWDIEAFGRFYLPGENAGEYDAHISLRRLLGKKLGFLEVGFENADRSPSFDFQTPSSFYLDEPKSLNTENSTHIYATLEQPGRRLKLTGSYFLLSNYTYLANYYQVRQAAALFTVLQINAIKDFRLGRHWHWRTWVSFQQKTGTAELNLPLLFTRNQFAYDGKLGFKNLLISFGGEIRYFTPYKADGYSPVQGQFYYQDSTEIRMRRPEMSAYVHFRIRSFVAYVRAENLNSFNFSKGNFTHNNILLPNYASPGLQIRIGIFWTFVN